jgi:light-regulated signal transduction histidine kinase (bacteriophytochrome)
MGHLIEDLLAFSRLSQLPLNKQTVAPAEIVQKSLAGLRAGQEQRNVEITIGDLPACEADPALLTQVWVNLLDNALKFTRKREAACIEVGFLPHSTPAGAVPGVGMDEVDTYFVRDNGVGFDMQYADKLFGVFQRLHRAEEYEGTGVGLAIVQRIVHRHGGRVWAEAEVDKGATFYFSLEGGIS